VSRLRRLLGDRRTHGGTGAPGAQDVDSLESDTSVEGQLDPNTAALTEGAPPAGAGGRVQPSGTSPDPREPRGPSEGEVQNLPG
jgi:hypothetical protein